MKKLYLILITAFLIPVFAYSQPNQVTLRIKLYPIQILEVNTYKSAECNNRQKQDSIQLDVHKKLNTYSTSNFVLKVQAKKYLQSLSLDLKDSAFIKDLSLGNSNQGFRSSFSEDEILNPYENDLGSHLLYSLEVL